ncbi:hypothetical protein BC831DRAFT_448772 [Entophlyctis helioformis]|nr:hypothetical protein BC831DRAFT_448772 [Entophlyctis helioformis]
MDKPLCAMDAKKKLPTACHLAPSLFCCSPCRCNRPHTYPSPAMSSYLGFGSDFGLFAMLDRSIISRSDLSLPTPPMSPYTLDMQAGTAATAGSGANMRTASRPRSIITSSVHPHRPPSEHPHPHSQVNPSSQSRVAQSEAAYAAHAATAAAAAHAAQLHQTDQVIQTLREQLARSQEQITKHDRVRLKLKGDLTSARTELFEKKEVIKELQDQLATAHNEHNSTKEELLDSQAALEAVRVELKLVRDAYDRALGWIIRQAHRQFVSSEIELHSVDRFLNHAYSSFASDARDDRHAPPAKRTWEFDSDYDSDTDIAATSTAWWRSDGQGHVPTWTKEAMLRAYFCSPNAASPTTSREGQSPLWSGIGDRRTLSYLAPSNQSLRFSSGLGMYSSTLGGNSSVSSFGSITGATMAATALPSSNLSPGRDTVNRMFVHPDRPAAGNSRAAVHTTPITLDLASGAERDKEAELSDATSRSSVAAVRLAAARGATAAGVNMGSISSISSIPDTIDDSLSSVQVKRASVNVNMLGAASGAATTGSRPAPWHRPAQNMPGVSEASAQQPTAVWQQQQQQDDDDDDDFEPSSVERSKAVLSRKPPAAALSKVGSTTPATGASATAKRTSVMVKTNEVYRFDESPRTPSADLKKIEDQDEDDSDFDDDYDGDDNDDEDDVDSQLDDYDGDSTSEGGTDMPMAVAESRANGPQARWNVDDATAAARTASVPRRQPGAEDSSSTSTEWRKDPQAVKALEDFLTADGNSEIEYHGKARLAVSRGSTVSAKTGVTTATATTATTAKVSVSAATRASRRHTTMMDGSHVVPAGSRDTKPPTGRTASTTHRFSTLSTSGMAANRPDATANNGLLSPGAASSSSGGGGERSSTIERMASSFENALETAIESPWSLVPGWLKSTRPAAPSAAVNTQPLTPQQLQQQTLSPD